MRELMVNICRRWENGVTSRADFDFDEQAAFFAEQGRRLSSLGVEWTWRAQRFFRPGRFFVLPDQTGVVIGCANNGQPHELVVVNADDQIRFVLTQPRISADWAYGLVHLELPRAGWPVGRIPFGPIACWSSRPDLPVMLGLNWETGEVVDFQLLPRFF